MMSMFKSNKLSLLSQLCKRYRYATSCSAPTQLLKTNNGVKLLVSNSVIPVSYINCYLLSGSRHYMDLSMLNCLRHYLFKYTNNKSGLRIIRETELLGAQLDTTLTREYLSLNVRCFPRDVSHFTNLFNEVLTNSKIQDHLVRDLNENIILEDNIHSLNIEKKLFDDLHLIAFRTGLGNPLFSNINNNNNNGIDSSQLHQFFNNNIKASNTVVVGINVDNENLGSNINTWKFNTNSINTNNNNISNTNNTNNNNNNNFKQNLTKSKYYGGEHRIITNNMINCLGIGFEGYKKYSKEYFALNILKYIINPNSNVKWGYGINNLQKELKDIRNSLVQVDNIGYSDIGLFTIYIKTNKENINKLTKIVCKGISSCFKSITEDNLKRARNMAKLEFYNKFENIENKSQMILYNEITKNKENNSISNNNNNNNNNNNLYEIANTLDQISLKDIKQLLSAIKKKNLSVVAYGNNNNIPFRDEIESLIKDY